MGETFSAVFGVRPKVLIYKIRLVGDFFQSVVIGLSILGKIFKGKCRAKNPKHPKKTRKKTILPDRFSPALPRLPRTTSIPSDLTAPWRSFKLTS